MALNVSGRVLKLAVFEVLGLLFWCALAFWRSSWLFWDVQFAFETECWDRESTKGHCENVVTDAGFPGHESPGWLLVVAPRPLDVVSLSPLVKRLALDGWQSLLLCEDNVSDWMFFRKFSVFSVSRVLYVRKNVTMHDLCVLLESSLNNPFIVVTTGVGWLVEMVHVFAKERKWPLLELECFSNRRDFIFHWRGSMKGENVWSVVHSKDFPHSLGHQLKRTVFAGSWVVEALSGEVLQYRGRRARDFAVHVKLLLGVWFGQVNALFVARACAKIAELVCVDPTLAFWAFLGPHLSGYDFESQCRRELAKRLSDKEKVTEAVGRVLVLHGTNISELIWLCNQSVFVVADSDFVWDLANWLNQPVVGWDTASARRAFEERDIRGLHWVAPGEEFVDSVKALLTDSLSTSRIIADCKCLWCADPHSLIANLIRGRPIVQPRLPENRSYFESNEKCYDLVVVLTVWKRRNLDKQLRAVWEQTCLTTQHVLIVVFQNGVHQNVSFLVKKWRSRFTLKGVEVRHIQSVLETGYFGRFLVPLSVPTEVDAYFVIQDDDVLFGRRYYENMIRLVDAGYLASRICRMLDSERSVVYPKWGDGRFVTFEKDLLCDYGGQMWAGRVSWLKSAWSHPPLDIATAEDVWLSVVLKTFLGVRTKSPRCPQPGKEGSNSRAELCACAEKSYRKHESAITGGVVGRDKVRASLIRRIADSFNFTRAEVDSPADYRNYISGGGLGYTIQEQRDLFDLPSFLGDCATWN